ncbi:hemolysin, partial [Serratia ureilytica]|nr:hemolysin [Serratia ureilytica]MBH3120572.1 hemolysin [Serratia ureilytica]
MSPAHNGAAQGATNTMGISASYGSQSSKNETRTASRQSQGSTLTAGQKPVDNANDGSISPIFNKEKEQNRLKQAQLIGEIGGQAMDVIRTQGEI